MSTRILLAALLLAACEPRLTGATSGLRVTVRGEGVDPGVVFVRFEPDESMPAAWAIDASGGLPASRILWTSRSGPLSVVAAAFDCPSSCRDVDPWTDTPTATGTADVQLHAQRTTSVTVHLEPRACGNGTVDPGEACDGGPSCRDDCTMPVVEQGTHAGGPDGGVEAIPTDGGFAVAWIDGSCGTGDCSCLSWMEWTPGGLVEGNLDAGATTCALDDDLGDALGWIDVSDPVAPELVALTSWPPGGTLGLGTTDDAALATPAVHGPEGDLLALGLAVEPELGGLELRWTAAGPTVDSFAAGPLEAGQTVGTPSLAVAGSGLAALWTVHGATYLRRWSLESATAPVPLETAAVELDADLETSLLLPSPEPDSLAILTMTGEALEVRTFPLAGEVPDEPDAPAASAAVGARIVDAASDPEHGLLVLLAVPVSGSPGCLTSLVTLDPDTGSRQIATWGADTTLGCEARLALLPEGRCAVAWRTPGSTAGEFAIQWTMTTIIAGF
jgi:hypothetical protein